MKANARQLARKQITTDKLQKINWQQITMQKLNAIGHESN
jgi:hypothetical protein